MPRAFIRQPIGTFDDLAPVNTMKIVVSIFFVCRNGSSQRPTCEILLFAIHHDRKIQLISYGLWDM